ncbi:MAG: T9SS type A sorting domain-containing protein [bacterium]|nr:T9SS type A sorting domain-containing protein [bacterium]
MHHSKRFLVLLALLPTLALAQFVWQDNGVAIRQGAHLGWNGAAVSAGDDVALFYYDCLRDGTRDVWGTRIAPNGTHVWGQNGRLVAGDISEQRAPVVAAYPDGSVLAVWEDYSVGRFRDLKAQRYSANGNAMWSPEGGVIVVEQERDQFDVKLALNDQDDAFIVFTDDRRTEGTDARINSYAQILTANGTRVGSLDGIQLLTRREDYNQPLDVVCVGSDAYILNTMPGTSNDLVIQKLLPNGTIGFPNDEAIATYADFGVHKLAPIENGLAVAWTSRVTDEQHGDARLTLLDTNRNPLAGWSSEGLLVGTGFNTQAVMKLSETPDGGIVIAVADYEFDADLSDLTISKYARTGELVWGPVELGAAALRTSPLDWYWDGDNLVVIWTEIVNFTEYSVFTQKLNSNGVKQWGEDGNLIWHRDTKKIRAEIEKPQNGAARVVIVQGRSIAQPESLFVAALNSSGQLAGEAEFVSGGWTYDSNDQRAARIDDQKLAVIWSDSRTSLNRDVYYQLIDGSGTSLLEPEGRKLSPAGNFSIYAPPAVAADGFGGAYMAWIGDSMGLGNTLHIHHINGAGNEVWAAPATIRSFYGFHGQTYLIPHGNGGLFAAFARFNDAFVARIGVAHINASGQLSWAEGYHEFPGVPGNDLPLMSAISDGSGGCYLTGMTGPWQDTRAIIFHIEADGTFGEGWSNEGRIYGVANTRGRNSKSVLVGENVLVTYEQPQSESASTYDVRGFLISPTAEDLWGAQGRRLSHVDGAVVRHQLSSDGQGGFLLGYEDFRSGNRTYAYIARYDNDGQAVWENVERRVCTFDGDQNSMTMTNDGNGGAWVAWEDQRNSDLYTEIDLYGTHIDANGDFASINGVNWPAEGAPICDVPTYQQEPALIPWASGSALAIWKDLRSSNPGRCCGAGAVGDLFNNVYAQVLSEVSLDGDEVAENVVPTSFTLSAYPNPFNPSTQLAFTLPQNTNVKLTIYNVLGQATETLMDTPLVAGDYSFTWNADNRPSGIYFAKLETSSGLSTVQKLTLLK